MKSIKLNQLNAQKMDSKSANQIRGGQNTDDSKCCCGCNYAGTPGGSSFLANRAANVAKELKSPNCHGGTVITPKPEDPSPGTQVRP